MTPLVRVLQILASVALVVAFVGVWSWKPALVWGGWLGFFMPAEAMGYMLGGTLSGCVIFLRKHRNPFLSALGNVITAAMFWASTHHWWFQQDLYPGKLRRWFDMAMLSAATLLAFGTSRARMAIDTAKAKVSKRGG